MFQTFERGLRYRRRGAMLRSEHSQWISEIPETKNEGISFYKTILFLLQQSTSTTNNFLPKFALLYETAYTVQFPATEDAN